MNNKRVWAIDALRVENSIRDSEKTIKLFENSISHAKERNLNSLSKIEGWEFEFNELNKNFIETNQIDFFQAQIYVDNSNNPNYEFNLGSFNEMKKLMDKIDGEKFFIHQRQQIIEKNIKIINEISNWIKCQKESLEINREDINENALIK